MNFGVVIIVMKSTDGMRFTRTGWNGKNQYIELQRPDAHSKMSLPYIFIKTVQGDLVPWLASQTDMLADDWVIYSDPSQPANAITSISCDGTVTVTQGATQ